MGNENNVILEFLRDNRRFADLFNGGLFGSDRLVPVYTLCLYHGENHWDGPRSLR